MKHLYFLCSAVASLTVAFPTLAQTTGVGIGITSPTQTLDVNGGLLVRGYRVVSTQGAYLQWNRTGGEGETWLLNQKGLSTNGNDGIRFGGVSTGDGVTEWARFIGNGQFGIGTTAPTALLDVNGSTRLRGLTVGVVTAAADGTLSSSSATAAFGTSFIQNTTAQQASSNFNISGNGTIGGNALVSGRVGIGNGTAAPGSTLQVAGSVAASIRVLTGTNLAPGVIGDADYTVLVTGYVTLPTASATNKGRLYYLLLGDNNGPYYIQGNLHPPGASTMVQSNYSAFVLGSSPNNYKSLTVQSDGTQWWIIAFQ